MEPIPEDEGNNSTEDGAQHSTESKSVRREIYRSEKVESSKRTVPEEKILSMENRYFDPNELGPPEMSSTSYNYSYESTYEQPPTAGETEESSEFRMMAEEKQNGFVLTQQEIDGDRLNIERQQKQTQKITRTTKVTTTRTVQHIPVDNDGSMGGVEYRIVSPHERTDQTSTEHHHHHHHYSSYEEEQHRRSQKSLTEVDIIGVGVVSTARRDTPSQPGTPQVVDVDSASCTIVWLRPDRTGDAGPLRGYQVQYRRVGEAHWRSASSELITEPLYIIQNLHHNGEYELRVLAENAAGFGDPSPTTVIQLRPSSHKFPHSIHTEPGVPSSPGRPRVIECDGVNVTLTWEPPVSTGAGGPVAGYRVEYRTIESTSWISAVDYLVKETRYRITGLKPDGIYEFRVLAKNADGFSPPSQHSDEFRVAQSPTHRGHLGHRRTHQRGLGHGTPDGKDGVPDPPSQPQVTDVDADRATLIWAPPASHRKHEDEAENQNLQYVLEYREIGDPNWYCATDRPIWGTQFSVGNLHRNSTYEFRVFSRNRHGLSEASEVSELCQLHPKIDPAKRSTVPSQPSAPEIMEVDADCVTLCWAPVRSTGVPLQGYQVEFRDFVHPPHTWLPVNSILTHSCKMTVGDLVPNGDYEFRVIAKNAIGYSKPSEPSQRVLVGGVAPLPSDGPLTAIPLERDPSFSSDSVPLPVELNPTKESPPITDTDDSPPPIRRKHDGVQYRDPTLPEVLDYLTSPNNVLKLNASGYLQHLTFHHDATKNRVRELDGIPRVIELLRSDVPEIQRNASGCLRNLSYGNDENKKAILNAGGVPALSGLLKKTPDMQVIEEISSVLWNLSSQEEIKMPILQHGVEPLVKLVVVPYSGWSSQGNFTDARSHPPAAFRNSTGVLRNISSANSSARKSMRERDGLVDALVHYLHMACDRGDVDIKSVENVICVIRNLSYRLQEIEDPNYDKKPPAHERSKSAPSSSPKAVKKKSNKKQRDENEEPTEKSPLFDQPATGVALLWQPEVVRDYLKLLDQSTNPDTLEGSAGAIQNLSACYWRPSVDLRTTVRKEKGLPILVALLSINNDKVVCAAATALRNLSLDERNKELIGKYAMEDLVKKLPTGAETQNSSSYVSDDTVAAVLSVIYAVTVRSPTFARTLLEKGGVQRLVYLSGSRQYSQRVSKYSSQVLYAIWQHKELHDSYKKAKFREEDFVSRVSGGRSQADTLAKPISTQGVEAEGPKSRVRPDWGDDYSSRSRAPSSMNVGQQEYGSRTPPASLPRTPQNGDQTPHSFSSEPTYSRVQKKNNRQQLSVPAQSPGYTTNGSKTPTAQPQALDSWV